MGTAEETGDAAEAAEAGITEEETGDAAAGAEAAAARTCGEDEGSARQRSRSRQKAARR